MTVWVANCSRGDASRAHLPAKALASTAAVGTRAATAWFMLANTNRLRRWKCFVHLTPLSSERSIYNAFRLEWADNLTDHFPVKNLPPNWNAEPPTFETMQIGDAGFGAASASWPYRA